MASCNFIAGQCLHGGECYFTHAAPNGSDPRRLPTTTIEKMSETKCAEFLATHCGLTGVPRAKEKLTQIAQSIEGTNKKCILYQHGQCIEKSHQHHKMKGKAQAPAHVPPPSQSEAKYSGKTNASQPTPHVSSSVPTSPATPTTPFNRYDLRSRTQELMDRIQEAHIFQDAKFMFNEDKVVEFKSRELKGLRDLYNKSGNQDNFMILKTLTSFLNGEGYGVLVFGVTDNGRASGVTIAPKDRVVFDEMKKHLYTLLQRVNREDHEHSVLFKQFDDDKEKYIVVVSIFRKVDAMFYFTFENKCYSYERKDGVSKPVKLKNILPFYPMCKALIDDWGLYSSKITFLENFQVADAQSFLLNVLKTNAFLKSKLTIFFDEGTFKDGKVQQSEVVEAVKDYVEAEHKGLKLRVEVFPRSDIWEEASRAAQTEGPSDAEATSKPKGKQSAPPKNDKHSMKEAEVGLEAAAAPKPKPKGKQTAPKNQNDKQSAKEAEVPSEAEAAPKPKPKGKQTAPPPPMQSAQEAAPKPKGKQHAPPKSQSDKQSAKEGSGPKVLGELTFVVENVNLGSLVMSIIAEHYEVERAWEIQVLKVKDNSKNNGSECWKTQATIITENQQDARALKQKICGRTLEFNELKNTFEAFCESNSVKFNIKPHILQRLQFASKNAFTDCQPYFVEWVEDSQSMLCKFRTPQQFAEFSRKIAHFQPQECAIDVPPLTLANAILHNASAQEAQWVADGLLATHSIPGRLDYACHCPLIDRLVNAVQKEMALPHDRYKGVQKVNNNGVLFLFTRQLGAIYLADIVRKLCKGHVKGVRYNIEPDQIIQIFFTTTPYIAHFLKRVIFAVLEGAKEGKLRHVPSKGKTGGCRATKSTGKGVGGNEVTAGIEEQGRGSVDLSGERANRTWAQCLPAVGVMMCLFNLMGAQFELPQCCKVMSKQNKKLTTFTIKGAGQLQIPVPSERQGDDIVFDIDIVNSYEFILSHVEDFTTFTRVSTTYSNQSISIEFPSQAVREKYCLRFQKEHNEMVVKSPLQNIPTVALHFAPLQMAQILLYFVGNVDIKNACFDGPQLLCTILNPNFIVRQTSELSLVSDNIFRFTKLEWSLHCWLNGQCKAYVHEEPKLKAESYFEVKPVDIDSFKKRMPRGFMVRELPS